MIGRSMEISDPISGLLQHKSSSLWSVTPDTMVYDAIALMAEKNVGALLVMDGSTLAGLITERDYTRDVALKDKSSHSTAVKEIMTAEPVLVAPSDTVQHCMEMMTNRRFRHLPVLDGDRVVGIVSIGDLVKWTISAQGAMIDQLENFIIGAYPA